MWQKCFVKFANYENKFILYISMIANDWRIYINCLFFGFNIDYLSIYVTLGFVDGTIKKMLYDKEVDIVKC